MLFRLFALTVLLSLTGCTGSIFFPDRGFSKKVESDLNSRRSIIGPRWNELSSALENSDDDRIGQSLKFLYAYMPLNDLADLPVDFFTQNTKMAIRAIDEAPWGKSVPVEVFLNFILPPRVNNENLDSFRMVVYDELKARIKGLDIKDAALEINRWCHEKVTYQSSDIRTSSPLNTMLSARGRCGEESTFTVAALRAAGIPARQVYTPRWAHSDDNHAWVEVLIDGKWFYMGACEPEPVLDRGWFTEPARRAMLIHTKAFGLYRGGENVIRNEQRFSEINNLGKYAKTRNIVVSVADSLGSPCREAIVDFGLYNYAEFYPIARIKTDKDGFCRFETGLGDLLVWSGDKNSFGFSFITVAEVDTVKIVMNLKPGFLPVIEKDIFPPVSPEPYPGLSQELIELNKKLIARGDSIRKKYTGSWMPEEEIKNFCLETGYDYNVAGNLIERSQGNYQEIVSFLNKNSNNKQLAVELLSQISEKDLRDTREYILTNHLVNTSDLIESVPDSVKQIWFKYVLNPRIDNEILADWRKKLPHDAGVPPGFNRNDSLHLRSLVNLIDERVNINDDENYYGTPLTPAGVLFLGTSDRSSRNILAVALYRSLGVPARLEPGTKRPQYFFRGNWIDLWFAGEVVPSPERSYITFKSNGEQPEPEYYIHFTLARYQDGKYNTLAFDFNKKVSSFEENVPIFPGNYMLVTGNRVSDSRILVRMSFFTVNPGDHIDLDVNPRFEPLPLLNLGDISSEDHKMLDSITGNGLSGISSDGGFMVAWMNPQTEPAKHLLNDLPEMKRQFERWAGKLIILVPGQADLDDLKQRSPSMPENTIFAIDSNFLLLKKLASRNAGKNVLPELPYVILVNEANVINYISEGYKIGIAEQLIKRIRY